ncbi:MAG TPA: ABC transporter substrate-binding protein [Candidatus Polarisedimenticolia bacterium]|nr:ABC transporter substrate-binding protein [Candidatus Polarisedimenticolia bacterium]
MRPATPLLALAAALVPAVLPVSREAGPGTVPAGTAVIAVGGDVDSFNPYTAASTFALDLADLLFLTLLEELPAQGPGEGPRFAPRLARSWEIASDGLSVTFHLRQDVRWSDGRPTTAEDVRFTWLTQKDPRLGWADADRKEAVQEVEAAGPYTVVFRLRRPGPFTLLDLNEGHILPRHALETPPLEQWRRTDFSGRLVTNGPFRLASWKPGEAVELARYEGYHEPGLPRLQRVVFRIVPDPAVRLRQTLSGESDVLEGVPPEAIDRLEAESSLRLIRFDQRMYTYVCWNLRRPAFADPRVRRALTMALDRAEMLRVLARGMGRPSAGPVVSSSWAADPSVAAPPYDPAGARRLLAEAGWRDADRDGVVEKDGAALRFDLEYNRGNTLREALALRIASQLAAVGAAAAPRAVEWAAFQSKHREGDFDAFVASRIASSRVDLGSFTAQDPLNHAGYADAELDSLVSRAAAAQTLELARPLWARAQAILARDLPFTFLFEQDRVYAVNRRLHGVSAGPLGLLGTLKEWSAGPPPAPPTPAPAAVPAPEAPR